MNSNTFFFKMLLTLCAFFVLCGCRKECDSSLNTTDHKQHDVKEYDFDEDGITDITRCSTSMVNAVTTFDDEGLANGFLQKKQRPGIC